MNTTVDQYPNIPDVLVWFADDNRASFCRNFVKLYGIEVAKLVDLCIKASEMSIITKCYPEAELVVLRRALAQMRHPEFTQYIQDMVDAVNSAGKLSYTELRAKFPNIPNAVAWFEHEEIRDTWSLMSINPNVDTSMLACKLSARKTLDEPGYKNDPKMEQLEWAYHEMSHPEFREYVAMKIGIAGAGQDNW